MKERARVMSVGKEYSIRHLVELAAQAAGGLRFPLAPALGVLSRSQRYSENYKDTDVPKL